MPERERTDNENLGAVQDTATFQVRARAIVGHGTGVMSVLPLSAVR